MTESRVDWHVDDDRGPVDDIPPEEARAARYRDESEAWNTYVELERRFRVTPPDRDAADAWDAGFDAGHEYARAVNADWPHAPANPYRRPTTGTPTSEGDDT